MVHHGHRIFCYVIANIYNFHLSIMDIKCLLCFDEYIGFVSVHHGHKIFCDCFCQYIQFSLIYKKYKYELLRNLTHILYAVRANTFSVEIYKQTFPGTTLHFWLLHKCHFVCRETQPYCTTFWQTYTSFRRYWNSMYTYFRISYLTFCTS